MIARVADLYASADIRPSLLGTGTTSMQWYLIHAKPRQEQRALLNLERQGYSCYLPLLSRERIIQREKKVVQEPLFPRYLFVRLDGGSPARGLAPVRSTLGVSRLVSFGAGPARIDGQLVEFLKLRESRSLASPESVFQSGERVLLSDGPFAGIEAVYQIDDGEQRAMVLIEFLSKPVMLRVSQASLRKIV